MQSIRFINKQFQAHAGTGYAPPGMVFTKKPDGEDRSSSTLKELSEMSHRSDVQALHSAILENAPFCHRLEFDYKLSDFGDLPFFMQALVILAEAPEHFDPEHKKYDIKDLKPLAFTRERVKEYSSISERVMISPDLKTVLIFRDKTLQEGEDKGCRFIALYTISEEEGINYFSGVHLYAYQFIGPDHSMLLERILFNIYNSVDQGLVPGLYDGLQIKAFIDKDKKE